MNSLKLFSMLLFLSVTLFGAESVSSDDTNDPALIEAVAYTMEKAPDFADLVRQVNPRFARAIASIKDNKKYMSANGSSKKASPQQTKQRKSKPILSYMITGMFGNEAALQDRYKNIMQQAGNVNYIKELSALDMYLFCQLCIDNLEHREVAENAIMDYLQSLQSVKD